MRLRAGFKTLVSAMKSAGRAMPSLSLFVVSPVGIRLRRSASALPRPSAFSRRNRVLKPALENQGGENAFTLLELILAVAIGVSVFIPAAALGVRGLSVWQRADGHLQQLFRIEKNLDILGEDLRNAVAQPDLPFKWSPEGLVFCTAADPSHLLQLRYRLESLQDGTKALIRESRPFPSRERESFLTKILLPKMRSFSVQFAVRTQGQPTAGWLDSWNVPDQIPIFVQVRMEVEDSYGRVEAVLKEYRIPSGVFGSVSR